ncbi:TetR/AcrR family transcriptional regulator [Halobacillus salinarum]|uniref:TetR/AcrR family transcriptional regulator n=1 Tax=Halobacillus salinarum TaxID=2932257 RepID=A0ABY4ELE4_9BACI|nr:TetR/AcrR family transcriptional regulator [Halobacillus salinarum]UOQ45225.1 TetR/AcrR family transcriptional regulator [Halobacillus salinarum]
MDEKSMLIIEHAMKLFAKKGFSSTSVQEIAKECGISKGAFYLHFKSKDELLFKIFYFYSRRIQTKTDEIEAMDLDPRTKFTKQLLVTFQEIADHREFIIMQIREQAVPFNENIEELLEHLRYGSYLFYKRHLLSVYGKEIDGILWEVSLLMQGMFKAFLDLIILENADLNLEEICETILRRTDFIVDGFRRTNDHPVITEEFMETIIPGEYYNKELEEITSTLKNLRDKATGDSLVTIEVLLEEIQKLEPRSAVIKGMLANLEDQQQYQGIAGQIRTYYQL